MDRVMRLLRGRRASDTSQITSAATVSTPPPMANGHREPRSAGGFFAAASAAFDGGATGADVATALSGV